MERKDLLEKLQEGLVKQFDALGEEFGVEGKDTELSIARIDTANTIMEIQEKLDWIEPKEFKGCVPPKVNINNFTTTELVEELSKREGVQRNDIKANMAERFTIFGPAIVLEIID